MTAANLLSLLVEVFWVLVGVWSIVLAVGILHVYRVAKQLRSDVVSSAGRCSANRDRAGEGEGARARVMRSQDADDSLRSDNAEVPEP
jgi:hypothetical protein